MKLLQLLYVSLVVMLCLSCKSISEKRFNSIQNGIICTIDSITEEFIYIQPQAVLLQYMGNIVPTKNSIDADGNVTYEEYTYVELTQNSFTYTLDLLKLRKVKRTLLFEYNSLEMPCEDDIKNSKYVIVYSGRYEDYLIGFAIFELNKKRERQIEKDYWLSTIYF